MQTLGEKLHQDILRLKNHRSSKKRKIATVTKPCESVRCKGSGNSFKSKKMKHSEQNIESTICTNEQIKNEMKDISSLNLVAGFTELTGSRRQMEDTHFIDKDCIAIFDGHGGDSISKYLSANYLSIFRNFLPNEPTQQQVCAAFKSTDIIMQDRIKGLIGGSTAIVLFILKDKIYVNSLGDCRAVFLDKLSGERFLTNFEIIDNNSGNCIKLSNQYSQTSIHAMPGLICNGKRPNLDEMSECNIENDDEIESAKREWMAFNHFTFKQRKKSNSYLKSSDFKALLPYFKNCGYRLSECGTQPTRRFSADSDQKTCSVGEVTIFEFSKEQIENMRIFIGCDGWEDNGAFSPEKIAKVFSINGFQEANKIFCENNLLINSHKLEEEESLFPSSWKKPSDEMSFNEKLECFRVSCSPSKPFSKKYRINMFNGWHPDDKFWCKSIYDDATKMIKEIEDNVESSWIGGTNDNLSRMTTFLGRLANERGSADNVSGICAEFTY